MAPDQLITGLSCSPGRLSFEAKLAGTAQRVSFRTETAVTPSADAALAACLMPAMREGGNLSLEHPISPQLLRTQCEFQAIQAAWSRDWELGIPPLREVEVIAPPRESEPTTPSGRVAAFFSGGVDSWATVLCEPEVTDLVFVRGFDILPGSAQQEELGERVEATLREVAAELGLPLHVVETDLRALSDPLIPWEAYFGAALGAVALFLGPLFDRVLIAGVTDYETQIPVGTSRLVDQLLSSEDLEIVDHGGRLNRLRRVELIASHPLVRRTLRVCWENRDGAYNCGRCPKCLLTTAELAAVGAGGQIATLPAEPDVEAVAALDIWRPLPLFFWEDVLDAARAAGMAELERAAEVAVLRGRGNLGQSRRRRRRRSPLAPGSRLAPAELPENAAGTSFFATPATAAALAEAQTVVAMVGGYDGSGNYGDIAQLAAALDLVAPFGTDALVLPVLERARKKNHLDLAGELPHPADQVLYFDPEGDGEDELIPVTLTAEPAFTAIYLYGGGFLNPSWGERKLAMLAAAEAAFAPSDPARTVRIATGLQVDGGWLDRLAERDADRLRSFELLGARDGRSEEALARLAPDVRVLDTADDAVGLLKDLAPAAAGAVDGRLRVNLNFGAHEWVTPDSAAMLDFYPRFLAELGARAGLPVSAQPLIAYLDPFVDERPGLERLAAACAEVGIELEEPLLLRPGTIAEAAATIAEAALTLSCSYHVALTSLIVGVPAILVGDNAYYDQKAAGLAEAFELPAELRVASSEDPLAAARRVADVVLRDGEPLRARLRELGAAVGRRRTEGEALARTILGAGALEALNAVAAASPPPPAAVDEEQLRRTEERLRGAEAKVAEVLGSRTWRTTEPLRQIAARLRARLRR